MSFVKFLPIVVILLSSVACSEAYIRKVLNDNPEIIAEIIENNPKVILDALGKASNKYREEEQVKRIKDEKKQLEDAFKNPKKPKLASERAFFGDEKAPITIVEYSDFQCPFCKRVADNAIEKVLKDYKKEVRLIYKHLPLEQIHPQAKIAAQYYEAVVKVDKSKAKMFHDKIFENQTKLGGGATFLDGLVREVGLTPAAVKKHLKSVESLIAEDVAEANEFGFSGTPAFLVGGVPISGAQPFSKFKELIDRHISEMEKKN